MLAASAPARAATLPPPGVGCLAAAASRKVPMGVEASNMGDDSAWRLLFLRAAGVVLHPARGQVDFGEARIRAGAVLDRDLVGLGRADGDHALAEVLGRVAPDGVDRNGVHAVVEMVVVVVAEAIQLVEG